MHYTQFNVKELHDLETYEVSLVPKGANGKQFLVFKNLKGAPGMKNAKAVLDWFTKNVDSAKMKEVAQVIKGLEGEQHREDELSGMGAPMEMAAPMDDKSKAALQAIARIASPMKESLHPGHLVKVLQAAGYDMKKGMEIFGNSDGEIHHPDGEPPASLRDSSQPLQKDHMKAIPEDILSDMKDVLKAKGDMNIDEVGKGHDDEIDGDDDMDEYEKAIKAHMGEAYGEAKKAYKAHMEKMGYRKYPDVQPRFKGVQKDIKQVDVGDIVHDDTEEKGMDVSKSLDLTKVDPKVKAALEAVFKGQKELVEKAAKLEKDNQKLKEDARHKEFVEKASKINVGAKTEDVAEILKALDPTKASQLESILKGVGEQLKTSGLFQEVGSATGGGAGTDPEAKIWALADGLVQKSADKPITREAAYEEVLKTAEGKRLYNEYMSAKPGMKV